MKNFYITKQANNVLPNFLFKISTAIFIPNQRPFIYQNHLKLIQKHYQSLKFTNSMVTFHCTLYMLHASYIRSPYTVRRRCHGSQQLSSSLFENIDNSFMSPAVKSSRIYKRGPNIANIHSSARARARYVRTRFVIFRCRYSLYPV